MTIYKCDRCGSEMTNMEDVCRIKVIADQNDLVDGSTVWFPYYKTRDFDVCKECAKYLMRYFVNQFGLEEQNNEHT